MQVYSNFSSKFSISLINFFILLSNLVCFFQLKKTLHKVIFYKFFKAGFGSESAFKKQFDPDIRLGYLTDNTGTVLYIRLFKVRTHQKPLLLVSAQMHKVFSFTSEFNG